MWVKFLGFLNKSLQSYRNPTVKTNLKLNEIVNVGGLKYFNRFAGQKSLLSI